MLKQIKMDEARGGTSLKGYITVNYGQVIEALGEPEESDGYKVSGEWVFRDAAGNEWTLYDWKMTSLYDEDLPTPFYLRNQPEVTLNVGGDNRDESAFQAFVGGLILLGVQVKDYETSAMAFERYKKEAGIE